MRVKDVEGVAHSTVYVTCLRQQWKGAGYVGASEEGAMPPTIMTNCSEENKRKIEKERLLTCNSRTIFITAKQEHY